MLRQPCSTDVSDARRMPRNMHDSGERDTDSSGGGFSTDVPPPPVSRNHLAQEPTPGSAVEFSHHFFDQGSGFFMFLVDVGQLFRWTSWMMMQSPCILMSQTPSLSLSRSQLQRRLQHRSLAPRGSTDRNSGWCITGRRVSRLSQLNNRSSHARWKAHYSPVS